jgi:hypothetical protein
VPDAYFLIHGSRDQDVSNFGGYNTYNRAHAVSVANPGVSTGQPKALLWVYGANHTHFNSVWQPEGAAATLTRAEQETVARVFIGAIAQARLLERSEYSALVSDHAAATTMMPAGINLVSQFQHPDRCYLQHQQESLAAPQVSLPVQGAANVDVAVAARQFRDLVNAGGPITWVTLRLQWGATGARMALQLNPATVPAGRYQVLALRLGQSAEAGNAAQRDQDLTIEVSSGSRTVAIAASAVHRLLYPDAFGAAKIVMQSLRIPLAELRSHGIEPTDIRSVALVFDKRSTGVVYVGDVQLSN